MIITESAPALAAAVEPAAYREALALLRNTQTGEERALLLEAMAAAAGRAAAAARGAVPADSADSTLAWEMTAVLLRQMAAAQRGCALYPVGDWDDERGNTADEWEDVARARTADEFTAAFAVLHGELIDRLARQDRGERVIATDVDPGDPAAPALARLAEAARALAEAAWESARSTAGR